MGAKRDRPCINHYMPPIYYVHVFHHRKCCSCYAFHDCDQSWNSTVIFNISTFQPHLHLQLQSNMTSSVTNVVHGHQLYTAPSCTRPPVVHGHQLHRSIRRDRGRIQNSTNTCRFNQLYSIQLGSIAVFWCWNNQGTCFFKYFN